jgi:hypothetical protein
MIMLFLFFVSLPKSLKPQRILDSIQKEILRRKSKSQEFVSRKIELLFSIIRRLRDDGESSDALYGINLIGETIRSIDLKEYEFLFLQFVISNFEDISVESLEKQPNLAFSSVSELSKILGFLEPKGSFFVVNIGNQIVSSSLTICQNLVNTRHARTIMTMTYSLVLRFCYLCALVDGYMPFALEALKRVVEYAKLSDLPDYLTLGGADIVVTQLLKKGKTEAAYSLFRTLFDVHPKDSWTLLFCVGVMYDNVRENEDFVSNIARDVKDNFESIKVEIKRKQDKSGSIGVRENTIEIEVGSDKDDFPALWVKRALEGV